MRDDWSWESRETWTVWYTTEEPLARRSEVDIRTEKSAATIAELKRQVGAQ